MFGAILLILFLIFCGPAIYRFTGNLMTFLVLIFCLAVVGGTIFGV